MFTNSLDAFFYPKSVAIVGATANPASFGCDYMNHILHYGYRGAIYPINPRQPEVFGIKAYPDLSKVPGTIDYVICCIGNNGVPSLLTLCAQKGVKAMHVLAGRGAETGRQEAKDLESEIWKRAKEYGIRLVGPNCLGVYCPETGLAFGYDFPKESGGVGAIIQSGGNSTDLVHIASLRGVRFSKVISYGNALDVNQNELFEYFADDPKTSVIVSYVEGLKGDTKQFLKILRKAAARKPVVICKGGRTNAGSRLTVTHTASLAGSGLVWEVAMRQAGAVPARHLDEMINMAVAFSMLPRIRGKRVALVGAGGGRSILSVDAWAENGFEIPRLPEEIRQEFKRRGSEIWDWIENPADASIMVPGDAFTMDAMTAEMAKSPVFDFIAADVQEDPPFGKDHFIELMSDLWRGYIRVRKEIQKPMLVIFDERSPGMAEADSWNYKTRAQSRTELVEAKMPFFPSVDEAAKAVNEVLWYHQYREEAG